MNLLLIEHYFSFVIVAQRRRKISKKAKNYQIGKSYTIITIFPQWLAISLFNNYNNVSTINVESFLQLVFLRIASFL